MLDPVSRIRRFNRAVTAEVGALDSSFLGRGRPLGAARVLNAIGQGRGDVAELRDYLESLGAAELIDRAALAEKPSRPLDRERWAGAIDAVGGNTLATILTTLKYRAAVAACGLAGGSGLPASVIPFLLRGISLLGIDSVMCPRDERVNAWNRLARDLPLDRLDRMTETVPLADLPSLAPRILNGAVRGRVVVAVADS